MSRNVTASSRESQVTIHTKSQPRHPGRCDVGVKIFSTENIFYLTFWSVCSSGDESEYSDVSDDEDIKMVMVVRQVSCDWWRLVT